MFKKVKLIGIIGLLVIIVALSGCTSSPEKQNTIPDNNTVNTTQSSTETVNTTQSEVEYLGDSQSNGESDGSPKDGKYNKILYSNGNDPIWDTDTCPVCGEPDAEAQTATDHLIFNKCTKCGYDFISIRKY